MKFSHLQAFEKHVELADPSHLSSLYFILDSEEYVQRKLARQLVNSGDALEEYFADEISLAQFAQCTTSFSMFAQNTCLILYRVDKGSVSLIKKIAEYCKKPEPHLRLVLCAQSMPKELTLLHKEGVILDLTAEKPWDRDKRLSFSIQEMLKSHKIRISQALSDQIVKMCASKVAVIDQEVEKLICYLKGKVEVSRSDLDLLSSNYQYSIFKVGQALFERRLQEAISIIEGEKFPLIMLIYSLRSLVQRIYRLKTLSQKDYHIYFPQLKGSFLEKNLAFSKIHSEKALKKMLQVLFEIELLMKSQPLDEVFLASLLILKIGALCEPISV